MIKQLLEMNTEELRKVLPITLREHNPIYKEWFEAETHDILKTVKPDNVARINHVGSSVVEGLIAKPIIDITLEIDGCCNVTQLTDDLKEIGYEFLRRSNDPMMIMFIKGYGFNGFMDKVYHLHVKYMGNWNELYFRDYLISHPHKATEYGNLKLEIMKNLKPNTAIFEHEYGNAKTDFILKCTEAGKLEFKDKYKPK